MSYSEYTTIIFELCRSSLIMSDILILAFVISILSHGYYVGASVRSARDEVNFESVNLNVDLSRVLKRVNERFLSVAIDASLVAEEKFMYLLT